MCILNRKQFVLFLAAVIVAVSLWGCKKSPASVGVDTIEASPRDWIKSATIYEVNIRQFSPEGNFAGVAQQLPRLKEMQVDVLWLMPIFPISTTKRKGTLGSYYAVSDYLQVNPDYGTMDDFKSLVNQIHAQGMKVILDWVPNHTGWDHVWMKKHPKFYTRDTKGKMTDPLDEAGKSMGWTDVADLNYDNPELRKAMTDAMLFWVNTIGIDGFRMDVAEMVPMDYWRQVIPQLRSANPAIMMLAESEYPPHRNEGLFDATYGWSLHHLLKDVAQGKKGPADIEAWLKADRTKFQKGFHMNFVTNHDENSWSGTEEELFGPAKNVLALLAFTLDGMPLLYSGQEANLNKRLKFFEKDPIEWGDYGRTRFFSYLFGLKHRQPALWNGEAGGEPMRVKTNSDDHAFAFKREKGNNLVIVLLNLSGETREVALQDPGIEGKYRDVFGAYEIIIAENVSFVMQPWGYAIMVQNPDLAPGN